MIILEKLTTTIQIQTAVNPPQAQMVTGSGLKFDYKNVAGVNNLDDPAVKSSEEDEEKDKKREVKHMQLHHSSSTVSTQTYRRVGSSGDRSL